MLYLVDQWISLLRSTDALIGVPLCLAGFALVYAGWRLWSVASFLSFGLVGGLIGQTISGDAAFNLVYFSVGGVALAVVGHLMAQYASVLLAGIVGGALTAVMLDVFRMVGPFQWLGAFLGFAGCAAWGFANRTRVIALITSFEGGALFVSGMTVMMGEISWLNSFFRSMTAESPFMVGFFLLVPTAIGVLVQAADANRTSSKTVQ